MIIKIWFLSIFFVHLHKKNNMNELTPLVDILDSFLGDSKNGLSDSGQIQYCCPACSEDDNVDYDGKFNLEINLIRNKFRCWKCEIDNGMSGKLSKLLKKYGDEHLLNKYRSQIIEIKKSKEYEFNFNQNSVSFEDDEELIIKLPGKTYEFKFDGNKKESNALTYLENRGIFENTIKKFDIKFTDNYCENVNFKNRIIIPSYDKYGSLNYYTCRDYTDKNFKKYYNYENSNRKDIIFNEKHINWDSDIVLVEGPFDHIIIPNSITLLGKYINKDYYLYDCILNKSTQNIYVFLDDDAISDAFEICKRLSSINLCGRLKIIPTKKLLNIINEKKGIELEKLDPSKLYELYKQKGIAWALKNAENYVCI